MDKFDFFMRAMAADEYRRRAWIVGAFALVREGPDDWMKNPYAYRIVQTPTNYFFVDPENDNKLSPIKGGVSGQPLFSFKDRIKLKAGQVPNLTKDVETTLGNVLLNYVTLVYGFGDKVPYQEGRVSPGQLEKLIVDRITDLPEEGAARDPKLLYTDEYLRFANGCFFLTGLAQLCVPATTRKTMLPAEGIVELRTKLIEENKERLHDPAVIAAIDAKLVQHDRDWIKGDRGEGFLIGKKSFEVVRKKLYSMHGAEVGLAEGNDVTLIERSLSEGWDIDKFPAMNDSLRAGSYNRGALTMLGGETVKWLLRASSNIVISQDDCGTQLGDVIHVDNDNHHKLAGFHIVGTKGPIHVTKETSKDFIGKSVILRTPQYCKLLLTDFCSKCCGDRLANSPAAVSAAVAEVGSIFMGIYMSASHGKALTVARLDYKTAIT